MELEGKVVSVLELQKGSSVKGEWKKQSLVVETVSDFPKKVCVIVWGDKVNVLSTLNAGDRISMTIEIESREFNGKWYTDVRATRIDKSVSFTAGANVNTTSNSVLPPMPSQDDFNAIYSTEDDLVF